MLFRKVLNASRRRPSKIPTRFFIAMMNANDDGDIIAHRVDFRLIEQFQKLDSRYSVEKYNKLEQRLITRDVVVVGTRPSSSSNAAKKAVRRVRTKRNDE